MHKHLITLLRRSFSTAAAPSPTFRCSNQIRRKYQSFVVQESQKALTEYLHGTQGLPFFFADQIARNSLFCLSRIILDLRFSVPAFPATIRKALRYQVINEFEFFLESIGIEYTDIPRYLPRNEFFLSDNGGAVLEAAAALFQFGFPWNTLGKLYAEKVSIFSTPGEELVAKLVGIGDFTGFHNLQIVGACLAFPHLLVGEFGDEDFEALFKDLKRVSEDFDKESDVDGWYEICCKIRFLYELGCERGTVGELTRTFLEIPKKVLEEKANYFSEFDVGKDEVRSLLLRNPELLRIDLQTPVISVSGLLEHFGLDAKELRSLSAKYPHVFGRNKMGNLPGIARALDLHEWFFKKFESLGCEIFETYAMDCSDQKVDEMFRDALKKIESKRYRSKIMTKLDFLMGLGFGENVSTLKVLHCLEVANNGLRERFDHLLSLGVKYSEACSMIKTAPRILCVSPELVEKKVEYLCNEMGFSLEHLDCFPRFLLFDLEKWIKPRHRFSLWLRQTGFMANNSSIQSIIDLSEKRFIARISALHRAAPKLYFECYLCKS